MTIKRRKRRKFIWSCKKDVEGGKDKMEEDGSYQNL